MRFYPGLALALAIGLQGCGAEQPGASGGARTSSDSVDLAAEVAQHKGDTVPPPGMPDWRITSDTRSGSTRSLTAVDLGSLQQMTPTIRKTWTALTMSSLKPASEERKPSTQIALELFDCTNRVTQSLMYVTHDSSGLARQEKAGTTSASNVLPGTVGETQWLAVCHPDRSQGLEAAPGTNIHQFFVKRLAAG